eukprot:8407150-Alexandrium_andersonii.AAC.1
MSASLVGSEMCIRDSQTHRANHGAPKKRKVAAASRRGGPGLGVPPGDACLLYTSDAADDM